jgi:acetyl-CoA acetyltransferase
MHQYGTTSRQFGAVAVACRKHANRNPDAIMYRQPMTLEDHQASRMIADPLRLLDCCLECDGAGAIVITSAERAKSMPHPPAYILAGAMGTGPHQASHRPYAYLNMAEFPETRYVARQLFGMAGVTPQDIDVAQIYEHFSVAVIIALEDLGFCKKGEGGPFVEGGRIEIGGEIPVNTSGGNLSEVYIHGITHIMEGVRQIRGTSTAQVLGAELSLVAGPNFIPTSALIFCR